MSGLLPIRPWGGDERSDRPESELQGVRSEAEALGRWEVRAAQFRALELARQAFGHGARCSMLALRYRGAIRGLMHLDVPFVDLEAHRVREATFLTLAANDPLLRQVPLIYVLGAANE